MRKLLKILIPLLVVALLALGAYTYFFQLAPDVTASIFLSWGDSAVKNGNDSWANRCYTWAYRLQPEQLSLAVDLSDSYFKAGNYNKAEYYLLDALRTYPDSAELYEKLSRVFVAQDKLLDAQELLDGAGVPAQVLQKRPAAPSFGTAPGNYSEKIELSISAQSGTVYASQDGQFPSMADGACQGLSLDSGSTTVMAVAVSSDGLVSALARGEYTISGVIEPVTFQDAALEAAVREQLELSQSQSIMSNMLWEIAEFTVPENVTELSPLQYMTGLTSLTITTSVEDSMEFLSKMNKLTSLTLDNCAVTSEQLAQIAKLPLLQTLSLSNCSLSSIAALSGMTELTELNLSDNYISDLTPLEGCKKLQTLHLEQNGISNIAALAKLPQLTVLNLANNQISSDAALNDCVKLQELDLSNNQLTAIGCIAKMPELRNFYASNNQLATLCDLSSCAALERLDVSNNKLTEISGVKPLMSLHYMNINYNDVKVLPSFASDCSLQQFYAAHNFLEDITGLSNLQELNYVDVDYNNISSIDCLATCPNIVQINAFRTNVTDISAFDKLSVIINYSLQDS